jgi:hypothetical protein
VPVTGITSHVGGWIFVVPVVSLRALSDSGAGSSGICYSSAAAVRNCGEGSADPATCHDWQVRQVAY